MAEWCGTNVWATVRSIGKEKKIVLAAESHPADLGSHAGSYRCRPVSQRAASFTTALTEEQEICRKSTGPLGRGGRQIGHEGKRLQTHQPRTTSTRNNGHSILMNHPMQLHCGECSFILHVGPCPYRHIGRGKGFRDTLTDVLKLPTRRNTMVHQCL